MHKKGQTEIINAVTGVVVIILIVTVFFVGIYFLRELDMRSRDEIIESKDIISRNIALINILNSPVEVEDKEITIGDLVLMFDEDRNYESVLRGKLIEIYNNLSPEDSEDFALGFFIYKEDKQKFDFYKTDKIYFSTNKAKKLDNLLFIYNSKGEKLKIDIFLEGVKKV